MNRKTFLCVTKLRSLGSVTFPLWAHRRWFPWTNWARDVERICGAAGAAGYDCISGDRSVMWWLLHCSG